jgi:hypothetical protein
MNVRGHQCDDHQKEQHGPHPYSEVNRWVALIIDGIESGVKPNSQQNQGCAAYSAEANPRGVLGRGFHDGELSSSRGVKQIKPTSDAAGEGENVYEDGHHC